MKISVADIRTEYKKGTLNETDVHQNPHTQFDRWFKEAIKSEIPEVNAMTLATASKLGRPSARTVLLKNYDDRGFVFFTNYDSAKGNDLQENPQAALLFFWEPLERQVRIVGRVEKISAAESWEYFRSRPVDSQLGAWASQQSAIVSTRDALDFAYKKMVDQFKNKQIPLPPNWGGYRIIPEEFEFWQGRASRLHDRISYTKLTDDAWKISRLSP